GLSFCIQFLTAFNAWCAAHAVGADLPLLYAVFLVLPVMLVAVVPISIAGWGIREGAMVAAFGYAGLPPGDGLIVSLLYGATFLTAGIIGGLVWLTTGRQKFQGEIAPADGSG
ncbi:MAG: lysylphosphatidylglycerol synthase domain-containing protein, partial [Pseudolabrys sp.]